MAFCAYGNQLVVVVSFHKTTLTTHRHVCGLISWGVRKRNCNIWFSAWSITQGHEHRGSSLFYLMLHKMNWILTSIEPLLCIVTRHSLIYKTFVEPPNLQSLPSGCAKTGCEPMHPTECCAGRWIGGGRATPLTRKRLQRLLKPAVQAGVCQVGERGKKTNTAPGRSRTHRSPPNLTWMWLSISHPAHCLSLHRDTSQCRDTPLLQLALGPPMPMRGQLEKETHRASHRGNWCHLH